MTTEITLAEAVELETLEAKVAAAKAAWLDAAAALEEILTKKLYRATHDTFEGYCLERWGMSRSYANRLVQGAKVVEKLPPIGGNPAESVIRPLVSLEPDERAEVWREAVELSPAGKPTAKDVREAVKTVVEKAEPKQRSAAATKALKRIEAVCGKEIAAAIRDGALQIESAELVAWAGQKDATMVNMSELVVAQRWAPSKASRFLSRMPDGRTTVDDIVNLAIAMGGEFEMTYGGGKLTYKRGRR